MKAAEILFSNWRPKLASTTRTDAVVSVCDMAAVADEYVHFLDCFAAQPGIALAYHYPFYLRFLTEVAIPGAELRLLIARNREGHIEGALPGLLITSSDIRIWASLAYFGPNGGALTHPDHDETAVLLLKAARADAMATRCLSMTVYTAVGVDLDLYRRGLGGPDYEIERVSQVVALSEDVSQSPWPKKVRYDIRKAKASGLQVRTAETIADLDALWQIYLENCESAGIPLKPRAHIHELYKRSGEHRICLVAELDGVIVAGIVCLIGGGVVSYYMPCSKPEVRSFQPGLFLLDQAVSHARFQGCRLLNFEASPDRAGGVFRFKARCGGKEQAYAVLVKYLIPEAPDILAEIGESGIKQAFPYVFVTPFGRL